MKVIVMVKATADSEAGIMPSEQLLTEMGNYNEELVKAGIMVAGEGLHPSSKGKRVRFAGQNRTMIDGPFAETKELVAGYWIWQVKSMDEAVAWLKRCPNPMLTESEIEIRPIFTIEDFGDAATPEVREQEARLRAETEKQCAPSPAAGAEGALTPRFENGPALLIAGLKQRYTLQTRVQIPQLWQKLAPSMGKVPTQVDAKSYGVCWNSDANCDFDYLAGVEVQSADKLPAGFDHLRIEPARYAVFQHQGQVSAIGQTIAAAWTQWLPTSGYQAASAPCFERYTEAFNPQTGSGGIELWLPLKT